MNQKNQKTTPPAPAEGFWKKYGVWLAMAALLLAFLESRLWPFHLILPFHVSWLPLQLCVFQLFFVLLALVFIGFAWRSFSNMKFAIILLIFWAVLSVAALFVGEFYPVKADRPDWQIYWQGKLHISQPLFNLFSFFNLHDPYRSWWYQYLLTLLILSLAACIIERLPIVLKGMTRRDLLGSQAIGRLALSRKFTVAGAPAEVRKRLPRWFGYKSDQAEGEWRAAGTHGIFADWGPILSHTGLLALAVGGLLSSVMGFSTWITGTDGAVRTDPAFDFSVRVDSFRIEYYPLGIGQNVLVDGTFPGEIVGKEKGDIWLVRTRGHEGVIESPVEAARLRVNQDRANVKTYASYITLLEKQPDISRGTSAAPHDSTHMTHQGTMVEVRHDTVKVNHPLRYKGFRFYQTSYQKEPSADTRSALVVIRRQADGAAVDTINLTPSTPFILPDGSELWWTDFVADFKMDESGRVTSGSHELKNPALLLEVRRGDQELYHQWCFLDPRYKSVHMGQPEAIYGFEADLHVHEVYATVLEVKRNPGYELIWLGFILMTLGLALSFYISPQRIWVALQDKGEGCSEVYLGGFSSKNPDLFRQKFEHWVEHIKGK